MNIIYIKMEINYETIIKFLCDDIIQKTTITKKRMIDNLSKFPEKFREIIILKDISKYGITVKNRNEQNISFITSLLTLINNKFSKLDDLKEEQYIDNFLDEVKRLIKKKEFKFELDSKFNKNVIKNRLSELIISDGILIQLLSQIFSINFIILDFNKEKLYSIFPNEYLNPWKPILLFTKIEDIYEPVLLDTQTTFSYNDVFIRRLLNEDIEYYNKRYLEKEYSLVDNINDIINNYNYTDTNTETSDYKCETIPLVKEDDIFISSTRYTYNGLSKLKVVELREIITNKKLSINKRLKKDDMIKEIIKHLEK